MSGTTADKLNYLKSTKELLRQEINSDFPDLNLTTSSTFRQYPSGMSSSQLWMDAWISGGIKYNITYNGTHAFKTGNREFKDISMPNVSSAAFANITADTVTVGGPDHLSTIMFTTVSMVDRVYVNNLQRIDISSGDKSLCDSNSSIREIYLPRLVTVVGKSSWISSTIALKGRDIHLPRVTRIGKSALEGRSDGGYFYIGTELSTVCSLETTSGIASVTKIYVPASLVASYKSATNWSNYADKIQAEPGT